MPQMAPMNWLIMFLMFNLYFILFNTLSFFQISYKLKMTKNNFLIKTKSWMW
uniref:ATP synthase complex subunit 8 n=1 Tax=Tenomerga trabecula TaxID=2843307 RepID=A0A8F0JWP6_9COLE|nr:ATP synthase F0 subunit 8 [Tenomerga trabecula]